MKHIIGTDCSSVFLDELKDGWGEGARTIHCLASLCKVLVIIPPSGALCLCRLLQGVQQEPQIHRWLQEEWCLTPLASEMMWVEERKTCHCGGLHFHSKREHMGWSSDHTRASNSSLLDEILCLGIAALPLCSLTLASALWVHWAHWNYSWFMTVFQEKSYKAHMG